MTMSSFLQPLSRIQFRSFSNESNFDLRLATSFGRTSADKNSTQSSTKNEYKSNDTEGVERLGHDHLIHIKMKCSNLVIPIYPL
jgi:hypothetical protein